MKNALDGNILLSGGGHNMAAGFTLEKKNLESFKSFFLKNFSIFAKSLITSFNYDAEVSSTAFNKDFFSDISKIEPFGTGNPSPIFLFRDLKIIKTNILNKRHISAILKSKIGFSINSISFDSTNNKIGEYLLNYKKDLNVLGQIKQNFWNNKKKLQLTIRDIVL